MKEIVADPSLVAYCGLYCGACGSYRKEHCPGCHENAKASWCVVRKCCIENGIESCAQCATHTDPNDCKKFNNFISKVFGFVFRSNRQACILQIRKEGLDGHARIMAESGKQTIKK